MSAYDLQKFTENLQANCDELLRKAAKDTFQATGRRIKFRPMKELVAEYELRLKQN